MAFCFVVGTNEFTNNLKGAENITAQCRNCGNWSARCITRWPWFTVCWIPLIPLATKKRSEVACHVCRFHQDLKDRPDVQSMIDGGAPGQPPQQQQGPPPSQQQYGGAPPPPGQPGGYYGQGGGQGQKPQYQ